MKNLIVALVIIFILFLVMLSPFVEYFKKKESLSSYQGILDLKGKNIENKIFNLNGEWGFYWGKFLSPKAFKNTSKNGDTISVPHSWNQLKLKNGEQINSDGFATYRLKILFNKIEGKENFGIYLNRVSSAYKIWVNQDYRGGNGTVGKNLLTSIPKRMTKVFYFDHNYKSEIPLEIIVQVSNFHHLTGGIKSEILFGKAEEIQNYILLLKILESFILGSIITASIYQIIIFLFRKADKSSLYNGAFFFLIGVYLSGSGENLLMSLFPQLEWEFYLRVLHLSLSMSVFFYSFLLSYLYQREEIEILSKAIKIGLFIFTLVILFSSTKFYINALIFFHILIIFAIIYWLFLLVMAISRKQDGTKINF